MKVEIDTDEAYVYCSGIPVNCEGPVRFILHDDYGLVIAERDEARRWARRLWRILGKNDIELVQARIDKNKAIRLASNNLRPYNEARRDVSALEYENIALRAELEDRSIRLSTIEGTAKYMHAELEAARRELAALRQQQPASGED